jgi:hypothetical protein
MTRRPICFPASWHKTTPYPTGHSVAAGFTRG